MDDIDEDAWDDATYKVYETPRRRLNTSLETVGVSPERPHDAMMEKLKTPSYPEKIQILALIPEKWSREYTSKLFDVSEYLIQTACELKKAGGILAKPASRKGKALPQEDDEYS